MLDRLGQELNVRTAAGPAGMVWQEVEACMHMLTAVAPRAEAGKDQVRGERARAHTARGWATW